MAFHPETFLAESEWKARRPSLPPLKYRASDCVPSAPLLNKETESREQTDYTHQKKSRNSHLFPPTTLLCCGNPAASTSLLIENKGRVRSAVLGGMLRHRDPRATNLPSRSFIPGVFQFRAKHDLIQGNNEHKLRNPILQTTCSPCLCGCHTTVYNTFCLFLLHEEATEKPAI